MLERSSMLYHEVRRLARKIVPPKLERIGYENPLHPLMKVGLDVSVLDNDGNVKIKKSVPITNTFHVAFSRLFQAYWTAGDVITIQDTGNAAKTPEGLDGTGYKMYVNALATVDDYGVVIGTSNAAIDIEDYALTAQCGEGVGVDQVNHGAVGFVAPATDGTTRIFEIFRTFSNNSGTDIDIEEVGLYSIVKNNGVASNFYAMIERTLLSFTILDTDTDTVRYTISVVV